MGSASDSLLLTMHVIQCKPLQGVNTGIAHSNLTHCLGSKQVWGMRVSCQ